MKAIDMHVHVPRQTAEGSNEVEGTNASWR